VVGYDSPAQPSSYGGHQGSKEGYAREGYGQRASQSEYGSYGGSLNQSNISGLLLNNGGQCIFVSVVSLFHFNVQLSDGCREHDTPPPPSCSNCPWLGP